MTTWDAASKVGPITLSNGNRTGSSTSGLFGTAFGSTNRTIGKWYFEIATTGATASDIFGLSVPGAVTALSIGVSGGGRIWNQDIGGPTLFSTGVNIWCFATDLDANEIFIRCQSQGWNSFVGGVPIDDPAIPGSGFDLSFLTGGVGTPFFYTQTNGVGATLRTTLAQLADPPPTGYLPWDVDAQATATIMA